MTRISRRITALCGKLKDWTDDPTPDVRRVYNAAASAKIPAHQVNGLWHFFEEDREAILDGLGLRPKASDPIIRDRHETVSTSIAAA